MKQGGKTREILINHYKKYPDLQIQDLFKFIYQSVFGCEHLALSLEKSIEYINKEFEGQRPENYAETEPLDGNYQRVPLSVLNKGLSAETMGKLFFFSAKAEKNGLLDLTEKLEVLRELVKEKKLPFSSKNFEKEVEKWKAEGYSALHHSKVFKEKYNPSYRLISKDFIPFLPLFIKLDNLRDKKVIFAVEGGSASGKTTLGILLEKLYDCTVFHMDDFFLRPEQRTAERYAEIGGNIDRERFLAEVLEPLANGEDIDYRKFDCSTMSLGEKEHITPKNMVIVEGAYSMHPKFEKYYDFSVYLNIGTELQKERILKRNSPEFAERFFSDWIPMEQKYFSDTEISKRCDVIIDVL